MGLGDAAAAAVVVVFVVVFFVVLLWILVVRFLGAVTALGCWMVGDSLLLQEMKMVGCSFLVGALCSMRESSWERGRGV